MIRNHQPTIFGDQLIVGLSSVSDGDMKSTADNTQLIERNRANFLRSLGIQPEQAVICRVTYETDDFTRYDIVHTNDHIEFADAIATQQTGIALFLPLADCTGAVLYDTAQQVLMISHLGRHSVEQSGARKSVEFMREHFGSKPGDILVWLSPSPNGKDYPLWAFDNQSFSEVIIKQLLEAGILLRNIEVSPIDTVTDKNYFSHSEFLKGKRAEDGRYAIVAMMG